KKQHSKETRNEVKAGPRPAISSGVIGNLPVVGRIDRLNASPNLSGGRAVVLIPIGKKDFDQITAFVKDYRPQQSKLFQGRSNDDNLGEPGECGVMKFAPTNEQGVVALFVSHMKERFVS